jgi:hypothetical protein
VLARGRRAYLRRHYALSSADAIENIYLEKRRQDGDGLAITTPVLNGIRYPKPRSGETSSVPYQLTASQLAWVVTASVKCHGIYRGEHPGSASEGKNTYGDYGSRMIDITCQIQGISDGVNTGDETLSQGALVGFDFARLLREAMDGELDHVKRIVPKLVRTGNQKRAAVYALKVAALNMFTLTDAAVKKKTGATADETKALHAAAGKVRDGLVATDAGTTIVPIGTVGAPIGNVDDMFRINLSLR